MRDERINQEGDKMELDPEELAMLTRMVSFFEESERDSPSVDYLWISEMCAVSQHIPANLGQYGASDFNRKRDIRSFLENVYLNREEKFPEVLKEIIKPMMKNIGDVYIESYYREKIDELNRYLSAFGYELDNNLELTTTSEIIEQRREDRAFVFNALTNYPPEYTALKGAIERYANGGTDSYRQCLDSCRNLIENLIKKIANVPDWNNGLKQIIQSQRKRQLIKSIHAFLSAYGVHGSEIPKQKDTELGLKITEDCITWILRK